MENATPKTGLIFLNGFYDLDRLVFYRRVIQKATDCGYPLICADGGLRIFDVLNKAFNSNFRPTQLIGDLDSVADDGLLTGQSNYLGIEAIPEWVGRFDKDVTDGQLATVLSLEQFGCQRLHIYGSLPRFYEIDHFLGNLKLMRLVHQHCPEVDVEMRDPLQTVYRPRSVVRIERKTEIVSSQVNNDQPERISLIAHDRNVRVRRSSGLCWDLAGLWIDPDQPTAIRNEFLPAADSVTIELEPDSDPVLVIHNFYE